MMGKENKQNVNNKVPKLVIWIVVTVSYLLALFLIVFLSIKYYNPVSAPMQIGKMIDTFIDELGNGVTVASILITFIAEFIAEYGRKLNVFIKRTVAISVCLLFNFCRSANAAGMSLFCFSVIVFVFWTLTTLIIVVHMSRGIKVKVKKDIAVKTILGNFRNKKILSVQLFELDETQDSECMIYRFNYLDGFIQGDNDVNSILSATYKLEKEEVSKLEFVLISYQTLIDTGSDEARSELLNNIKKYKESLLDKLKKIKSVDDVRKEDCCIARLIIIYLTLEQRLTEDSFAGIVAGKGVLGIDAQIENRLFTYVRTGILGAIFFGKEDIYMFQYLKDGLKQGRQYCALQINNANIQNKIICMIVLKESSKFSIDIVNAIKKIEKKLNEQFSSYNEVNV